MVMLLQSPFVLCCILLFTYSQYYSMAFVSLQSSLSSSSILRNPTTTTTTTTTSTIILYSTTTAKDELEKYTIKELKQFIIDEQITIPKGMSAKLKRKADIVEFIVQQQQQNTDVINKEQPLETITDHPKTTAARINHPRRMPPMPKNNREETAVKVMENQSSSTNHNSNNNDDQSEERSNSSDSSNTATPKDVIIEQILERYPPLRTQMKLSDRLESQNIPYVQARLDGAGENDIRHVHHPMMRSTPSSSDMDVIFVGTASCTPGYTRGVSCTALRLQWRRNPNDIPTTKKQRQTQKGQEKPNPTNNNNNNNNNIPGTWLFDVGECSQVRDNICLSFNHAMKQMYVCM